MDLWILTLYRRLRQISVSKGQHIVVFEQTQISTIKVLHKVVLPQKWHRKESTPAANEETLFQKEDFLVHVITRK